MAGAIVGAVAIVSLLPPRWWMRGLVFISPLVALCSEAINGELWVSLGFLLVDIPEVIAIGCLAIITYRRVCAHWPSAAQRT